MNFEMELTTRSEVLFYHVLTRRAANRLSEDPLQNKPQWFVILRSVEARSGFIVSYRATLYHNLNMIRIAIVGVNRAQINEYSDVDGVGFCSGRILRDVNRQKVI